MDQHLAHIRSRGMTVQQRIALLRVRSRSTGPKNPETNECRQVPIRHLENILRKFPHVLAVPYMRVSTHEQRKHLNLRNRELHLQDFLDQLGVERADPHTDVVSGKSLEDRPGLIRAIEAARKLQSERPDVRVIVVTDARNRYLRAQHYNGTANSDRRTAAQFKCLGDIAGAVILATILPPEATANEVRRFETNVPTALGEKSGKRVGRPKKPHAIPEDPEWTKEDIRNDKIRYTFEMYYHDGMSKRGIAKCLGVSEGIVRRWVARSVKATLGA